MVGHSARKRLKKNKKFWGGNVIISAMSGGSGSDVMCGHCTSASSAPGTLGQVLALML